MDESTSEKLKEVLKKDTARQLVLAEEKRKLNAEKQEREERKKTAQSLWETVSKELHSVVSKINAEIKSAGLEFRIEEGNKPEQAISQTLIKLFPPKGHSGRQVVFNVNAFGHVSPVFLVPHSGRTPQDFALEAATSESLSALLVDFLDQALAYEDKKK